MARISVLVILVGIRLAGCGNDPATLCSDTDEQEEEDGTPTGATCNDSMLTYESFGRGFMTKYCTSCHSSALKGEEARQCAPAEHDFDTLDAILLERKHVDEHAAAGPNAVNDEMPPSGAQPTDSERRDLGTWLACEEERMP